MKCLEIGLYIDKDDDDEMFICEKDVIDYDDITSLLDLIDTDPMELEMLKNNLNDIVLLKEVGQISYRADLINAFIEYYKKNPHMPLIIEFIGIDKKLVKNLSYAFMKYLDDTYSTVNFYDDVTNTVAFNSKLLVALHTKMEEQDMKEFLNTFLIGNMASNKTVRGRVNAKLLLEILGPAKTGEIVCVIYDRKYNMQGIVAFNI